MQLLQASQHLEKDAPQLLLPEVRPLSFVLVDFSKQVPSVSELHHDAA
jgi:hypothetical protein